MSSIALHDGPSKPSTEYAPTHPRDVAATALVLGVASSAWWGWGASALPAGWQLVAGLGSGLGLLVALIGGVLVWRRRRTGSVMADPANRRTYHRVVGLEVVLIAVGAAALTAIGGSDYLSAWVLLVVGGHFLPLARLFRVRSLAVCGALLVAAAVVAAAVAAAVVGGLNLALSAAVAGPAGGILMAAFGAIAAAGASHR
jgi:hypothetical protein